MFDYFYNQENEQYLFLQIPKMLIKDPRFKNLSGDAKILYSLLLDRTSLSKKNDWTDDEGRVYIIYTQASIMEDLNCRTEKATRLMKELREIGLVETVRRGLGKPNLIYVMNFATELKYTKKTSNPQADNAKEPQKFGNRKSENFEEQTHRNSEIENQKVRESNTIKTYPNQTYSNQTERELNQSIDEPVDNFQETSDLKADTQINSINKPTSSKSFNISKSYSPFNQSTEELLRDAKLRDNLLSAEEIARLVESLHINMLKTRNPLYSEQLNEIRDIIIDILQSNKKEYKISDEIIPAFRIKYNFLQLTSDHIQYLLDSLNKTSSKIRNIKFYLIKSLYNAPLTFNNHLQQDVNHALMS